MKHTCPACGAQWDCECGPAVIFEHYEKFGNHPEEIGCSKKCANQLSALLVFLSRYRV